jgi:hypothetical protein
VVSERRRRAERMKRTPLLLKEEAIAASKVDSADFFGMRYEKRRPITC